MKVVSEKKHFAVQTFVFGVLSLLVSVVSCAAEQSSSAVKNGPVGKVVATLTIDTEDQIGQVCPYVLGHFFEHFPRQIYGGVYEEGSAHSDANGFRLDVERALKQMMPPLIRWPGGNYTSAYHWRWGAGAKGDRPKTIDPVWGQTETHRFGTTEFVELCRRVGAEPLICVGLGRDPRNPSAEEAASWVRYCNATEGPEAQLRAKAGHPEPLNVTLWGLGNEVYGKWQVGGYKDPKLYAKDLVIYARAMREADPRIKFVVCGASENWNRAVLTDEVLKVADWISYHNYFTLGWAGPRKSHKVCTEHLMKVEADIGTCARLNRQLSRRAGRSAPITLSVDEWNQFGWAEKERAPENDEPQPYDLAHALYTAGFLNIFLRSAADVTMANYSPTVNCRGCIYADERGIVLRPTYYVFDMYRPCAGATAVRTKFSGPGLENCQAPVLDTAAVRRGDGSLVLFAINRDPEQQIQCHIQTKGFDAKKSRAKVLTADALDRFNDFGHPDDVAPSDLQVNVKGSDFDVTFPARSITVLHLEP